MYDEIIKEGSKKSEEITLKYGIKQVRRRY